ncbi:unnamed protein product [Caenorhabditis angaria]|uniref:Uncharacterized protein n=1 Tax=Caenorhabditis angaria TaxID=860376 RepID=A0A9P1IWT7_9PELO|nr:unnamed protein product [Caenorhabditis angaria]
MMFNILFLFSVLFLVESLEVVESTFPMSGDYNAEKTRLGGVEPPTYSKTYHRVLPGGHEHAEVNVLNQPGANSWSSSYQKQQSFGSSSPQDSARSSQAYQNALANHMAMQKMHQDNMMMSMGMGLGVPTVYGSTHKFSPYAPEFDNWMHQHMRFMENMMKFQQKQFEAIQTMILEMQKNMATRIKSNRNVYH